MLTLVEAGKISALCDCALAMSLSTGLAISAFLQDLALMVSTDSAVVN